MDRDADTTPFPIGKPDTTLFKRQKYHFNRYDGKRDSRKTFGTLFYERAVKKYNNAVNKYNSDLKELKNTYPESSDQFKNKSQKLNNTRDNAIASALVDLGAALHCYQDVYAHGNIAKGSKKSLERIRGHANMNNVDNPYYKWEDSYLKNRVVENYNKNKELALSSRYNDTKEKTKEIINDFRKDIKKKNYIFTDVKGDKINKKNINNKYFSKPNINTNL